MMTKTIKISKNTPDALFELASKKDTFNDVITRLIKYTKKMKSLLMKKLNFIIMK